jgi:UDP-2-acetamido-2-deoxy-ribo-hexuluronate aminotransferase
MDEINAIASKYNLPVIEDAAQSFGATYKVKKSCNLSTIGCTSFFPSKPLGCYGDGGAIFTNDDELAKAMREIRIHGQKARYVHSRVGIGGRMDTIQCAVLLAKLDRFDWEVSQRQRVAERYRTLLSGLEPAIELPEVKPDRTSVWAQYTLRVPDREALQAELHERGIPTAVHYPTPLYQQAAYAQEISLPITEKASREVMSLPMHPRLDETTQNVIMKALRQVIFATGA